MNMRLEIRSIVLMNNQSAKVSKFHFHFRDFWTNFKTNDWLLTAGHGGAEGLWYNPCIDSKIFFISDNELRQFHGHCWLHGSLSRSYDSWCVFPQTHNSRVEIHQSRNSFPDRAPNNTQSVLAVIAVASFLEIFNLHLSSGKLVQQCYKTVIFMKFRKSHHFKKLSKQNPNPRPRNIWKCISWTSSGCQEILVGSLTLIW